MRGWVAWLFGRLPPTQDRHEPAPPPDRPSGAPNIIPAEPAAPIQVPAPPPRKARKRRPRNARVFVVAVVGESFKNDDGSDRQAIIRSCRVGEAVALKHEPYNQFDPNAIAVCRTSDGTQIGYLRSNVAARLLDELANEFAARATIHDIRGGPPLNLSGVWLEITLMDARNYDAG